MSAFDGIVLASAGLLVLLGVWRGLVRVALGVAGLVVGLVLGLRWEGAVAPVFRRMIDDDLWSRLFAFVAIVLAVAIGAGVLSWLLRRLLRAVRLVWIDRLLGAAAGLVCAVLLSGALALILTTSLPPDSRFLADSRLAPFTLQVSRGLAHLAPEEMRQRFRREMERLTAVS